MAEQDFDNVWKAIEASAGEDFRTKTGRKFRYHCDQGHVYPDHTNHRISASDFRKALKRLPCSGPRALNDLRGPSYVWAILSDQRISRSE